MHTLLRTIFLHSRTGLLIGGVFLAGLLTSGCAADAGDEDADDGGEDVATAEEAFSTLACANSADNNFKVFAADLSLYANPCLETDGNGNVRAAIALTWTRPGGVLSGSKLQEFKIHTRLEKKNSDGSGYNQYYVTQVCDRMAALNTSATGGTVCRTGWTSRGSRKFQTDGWIEWTINGNPYAFSLDGTAWK